jgi:DNA-binding MarR family transcriptional regulator
LAKQNLVRRRRNQNDRRVIYTEITPAGLEKLQSLDPLVVESVQNHMKHMSQDRLALLIDLLEDARQQVS